MSAFSCRTVPAIYRRPKQRWPYRQALWWCCHCYVAGGVFPLPGRCAPSFGPSSGSPTNLVTRVTFARAHARLKPTACQMRSCDCGANVTRSARLFVGKKRQNKPSKRSQRFVFTRAIILRWWRLQNRLCVRRRRPQPFSRHGSSVVPAFRIAVMRNGIVTTSQMPWTKRCGP